MKRKLAAGMSIPVNEIDVMPFFEPGEYTAMNAIQREGFIYAADGVPQKNHTVLLDAWEILYKNGEQPVLHLTIPARFEALNNRIRAMQEKGIRIINHSVVGKTELIRLYRECSYLVFPSLAESFGLPLIEAAQEGAGVLAANLPYVSDVIMPSGSFDPNSATDLAQKVSAVKEHRHIPARLKIMNHIDQLIALLKSL